MWSSEQLAALYGHSPNFAEDDDFLATFSDYITYCDFEPVRPSIWIHMICFTGNTISLDGHLIGTMKPVLGIGWYFRSTLAMWLKLCSVSQFDTERLSRFNNG